MLFLETTAEPLTVLPTHRIVRGLGDDGVAPLRAGLGRSVRRPSRRPRTSCWPRSAAEPRRRGGDGRFGLWTRDRRSDPDGSPGRVRAAAARRAVGASARLDVVLLGAALERLAGIDPAAVAAGGRVGFTKSVDEALAAVDDRARRRRRRVPPRADPVASIAAVAGRGRRDAPEVDLLLSEGPDRPRDQPPRMVSMP